MTAPARPRRPQAPGRGVVPAAPRLAQRASAERSTRRRRRARRAGSALLVLLPLAGLAWLVLASPVLAVDRLEVVGHQRLGAEDVVRAASVPDGTPLARVDVGAVARRIERELLPVADVRVRRVWPSTLELQVTERTAVAAVRQPDERALLVDAEGVGFAQEQAVPGDLPLLAVARPSPDDPATLAGLAVLTEIPPWLGGQVAVVRAEGPSAVQLVLDDERTVVWGAPGDALTKATALGALLEMPGTFFDVSAPGVVVRR